MLVLGEHLLDLHLLRNIVIGNGAMAHGKVGIFQNRLEDILGEADGLDSALSQDGLSVRGDAHAVVSIMEHSVDVNNYVS